MPLFVIFISVPRSNGWKLGDQELQGRGGGDGLIFELNLRRFLSLSIFLGIMKNQVHIDRYLVYTNQRYFSHY